MFKKPFIDSLLKNSEFYHFFQEFHDALPNPVILDVRIPGMPGDEVCKNIKSDDQLKHTPVILFTASVQKLEGKVDEACADGFLIKPFEPEQLIEKIKKLIG